MTPNSRNQFKRKHVSARGENLQEDLQSARVVKTIVIRLLFLIVRYWLLKNFKALYRFDITVVFIHVHCVFIGRHTFLRLWGQ